MYLWEKRNRLQIKQAFLFNSTIMKRNYNCKQEFWPFLQPQNAFNKFMDIYFYILRKLEKMISEYIYTPAKVGPRGLGEAYN